VDALNETFDLVGFIDDVTEKHGTRSNGIPIFGREALSSYPDARVLAVPGSPASYLQRREVIAGLGIAPSRFVNVIHPTARVSRSASLGYNVLIMAGAVLTSNVKVGNHVCILPNAVVNHDTAIGDWSLIASGVTIGGGCAIGQNCYIGSGSSIIHAITVGDDALIGLGTNVIASIPSGARVVGNPARIIGSTRMAVGVGAV
jgi:sugar O-acyltransferase (sialic acid O-acetyltransferase NeuD family)